MDSQSDDGSLEPTRDPRSAPPDGPGPDGPEAADPASTRRVTDYEDEVAHYRRPLLGAPWIAAALLVPALLAGIGLSRPVASTAVPSTAALDSQGAPTSAAPAASASGTAGPSASPSASASTAKVPVLALTQSQDLKTVTISGSVPDAASRTAAITALGTAFGAGVTIADTLTITPGAPAVDAATFGPLAAALKAVQGLNFSAQGGAVTVSGLAPSDQAKTAVVNAAKKSYPNATVQSGNLVVGSATQLPSNCDGTAAYVQAVTARTEIQFASGTSTLTSASLAALVKVADAARKCPTLKLQAAGNTDNVGDPTANKNLSLTRANVVKAQLVKDGVAAASITTVGQGDTKPLTTNGTPAGQAANRRVDITVQ